MPKDHKRNTKPLQEARKRISDEKYNTLKNTLDDMTRYNEPITISRVCELSGLSKSYLYQNSDAKQLFTQAQKQQKEKAHYSHSTSKNDSDFLLQYKELKRKLLETYYLQRQLLEDANEHLKETNAELKQEVEQAEALYKEKKAHIDKCPKIAVDFFITKDLENKIIPYQFITKYHTLSPVQPTTFYHIKWGTYKIRSKNHTFELLTDSPSIILEKQDDTTFILTITDELKEDTVIEILIKPNQINQ